jgi:hypothetical protein
MGRRRICSARANPRNLKGFLDAFKAVFGFIFNAFPAGGARSDGRNPPSLTAQEDFA